ncbi:MAG: DNA-methyltransferase [Candidatus Hodarchaeota archaeon]
MEKYLGVGHIPNPKPIFVELIIMCCVKKSISNPTLWIIHEYILIFSKNTFKRVKIEGRNDTIPRDEFLEYTKSIWSFPTESAKKIGHPAPFPVELPYRCIQLFSYSNEIILDPFMGSGQTAIAAIKTNRRYVGYDINEKYVELAEQRINEFKKKLTK